MNPFDPSSSIYESLEHYQKSGEILSSLRLHRFEWDLYLAIDGKKTGKEIGQCLGIPDALLFATIEKLKREQLIRSRSYSLEEYRTAFPAGAVPLKPEKNSPGANPGEPSPSVRPSGKQVSFSLKRASPAAPPSRKLMPMMNFVIQKAGGGIAGQIAAYRVLLKVPQPLLQTMQIESLSLTDENYEIPSQEAYNAILEGVKAVVNVPYESNGH